LRLIESPAARPGFLLFASRRRSTGKVAELPNMLNQSQIASGDA